MKTDCCMKLHVYVQNIFRVNDILCMDVRNCYRYTFFCGIIRSMINFLCLSTAKRYLNTFSFCLKAFISFLPFFLREKLISLFFFFCTSEFHTSVNEVKLATVVEGDPKAPFSIGVAPSPTPLCKGDATPYSGLAYFTLDPYLL